MDKPDLNFVRSLIQGHIQNARRGLPKDHSGHGSSLFDLNNILIKRAESAVADTLLADNMDDYARGMAGVDLQQTLKEVEKTLPFMRPLMESVRRDDIPLGLLVMLDSAIDELLPNGADPVVHFDDQHMYSTIDLYKVMGLEQVVEATPIVFFLPVLDPYNALLMPLLVHEIGHTSISQASLRNIFYPEIYQLLERYFDDIDSKTVVKVRTKLNDWVDELLCDCLAVSVCGPAYLFAAAAFLPATANDDSTSSHPFPSERLRQILAALESRNWLTMLEETCPQTMNWLRKHGTISGELSKDKAFLRDACRTFQPMIDSVVKDHVRKPFNADDYRKISSLALDKLRMHIPPSEINNKPLAPWHILLLGWQYSFDVYGDLPSTLARAPNDRDLSKLILRSIEIAQILRLWGECT